MNVLSLFDGISCGQLALQRAGIQYDAYYSSEIDPYAIKVTQANFPQTIQLGSIDTVVGADLPPIDLLIGGSPCQGFSTAGKMHGFNDPRSKLFFEYVRLLQECKPKYFLLENVVMKKQDQAVITNILGVEPVMINSNLVSAQNRKRLYWTNIPMNGLPQDRGIMLASILETNPDPKFNLSQAAINKLQRRSQWAKPLYTPASPKTGTLIAGYAKIPGDGSYLDDGNAKRRFTPTECERLQNVPDGYTACIPNTYRYHALGNGWTVDVIAHIFNGIKTVSVNP